MRGDKMTAQPRAALDALGVPTPDNVAFFPLHAFLALDATCTGSCCLQRPACTRCKPQLPLDHPAESRLRYFKMPLSKPDFFQVVKESGMRVSKSYDMHWLFLFYSSGHLGHPL